MAETVAERAFPSFNRSVRSSLAILVWLGAMHFNFLMALLVLVYFPSPWTFALLGFYLLLFISPINSNSPFGLRLAKFIFENAPRHFPIELVVEDKDAFNPARAYVLAAEPHSVLPIGIIALCNHTGDMPFKKIKALASSAIFFTPVLRQIWTWMGLVPASRTGFLQLLCQGYSCIIVPGGVRECLYMQQGHEVVFLKQRYGFVRVAIEAGAPIVPVFCFGQTGVYRWWKPTGKWYDRISRAIGFTPLIFWGMYGSPIPFQRPMHVVVGKPIEVAKNCQPSREQVSEVLSKYILALEQLFEDHKGAAGYKDTLLSVH